MDINELKEHIYSTYVNLRYGIAFIGILIPIILIIWGLICSVEIQNSVSAYFHADPHGFSLRTIFVGGLIAIGVALYLYKGYGEKENIALNLAGISAVGVALFPMSWEDKSRDYLFEGIELYDVISLHGFCAVLMFVCMAYVCIFCSSETLGELRKPNATAEEIEVENKKIKRYQMIYRIQGYAMILFPLVAFVLVSFLGISNKLVLVIEILGIFVFVSYWWVKSREITLTSADKKVLNGSFRNY